MNCIMFHTPVIYSLTVDSSFAVFKKKKFKCLQTFPNVPRRVENFFTKHCTHLFPMNEKFAGWNGPCDPWRTQSHSEGILAIIHLNVFFVHLGKIGLGKIPLGENCIEGRGHSIPKGERKCSEEQFLHFISCYTTCNTMSLRDHKEAASQYLRLKQTLTFGHHHHHHHCQSCHN